MTKKQYISQLTGAEQGIRGKDVLEKDRVRVIDGLCDVIAEKDTVIADQAAVIASKDADIARLNHQVMLFQRQIYGRRSGKLHPEDPNQLSLDFGEEQVLPLSDDQLKEEGERVEDTKLAVPREADRRRAQKKAAQSRKGQTYRIGPEVPRREPVEFYPEGYDPETMTVIGWNTHEYLEIEGPRVSVRVEREAVCKLRDAKPTDAHTQIFEARKSQNCLPGCIAGNKTMVSTNRPMATIITDKYCHHLPEYRQVKRFEAMGLKLSTTSVNRWQHDLADVLLPIYEQQTELVLSSKYQHLDETTIPVNDQRRHTRKGYIWDAVDGMGEYGLVFFYEKGSRGGKVIRPKLLHRKAAIQSDGYLVYENIEKSQMEGIVTLYCMAHARRKFFDRQSDQRSSVSRSRTPHPKRGKSRSISPRSTSWRQTSSMPVPTTTRHAASGRRRPCPYSASSG